MKVTREFLEEKKVCASSVRHIIENNYMGLEIPECIEKLMSEGRFSDSNWLITRLLDKKNLKAYAINATEFVLPFFEAKGFKDSCLYDIVRKAKEMNRGDYDQDTAIEFSEVAADIAANTNKPCDVASIITASAAYAVTAYDVYDDRNNSIADDAYFAADLAHDATHIIAFDHDINEEDIEKQIIQYGLNLFNNQNI